MPMQTAISDLRSALRQLGKRPAGTIVSVLALAAGIGGATAIFTVADSTLLRSLPYPHPDELVRVWETTPDGVDFASAEPTFLDFQERTRAFASLAAMRDEHPTLTNVGEPERLDGAAVSPSLFPLLGVEPALGRAFTGAEAQPGSPARLVLLSDELWRRRFDADASVVGRTITLDGEPHIVTGVMPPGFEFAPGVDVWLPLAPSIAAERDNRWLGIVGRLKPGVTLAQARSDMSRIATELGAEYPRSNSGYGVRLATFSDWLYGAGYRNTVWVLTGAVACLLLLACANIANLLVAQASEREAEIGIRTALGASSGRLVRQLFTESVVLAILGGAGGILVAAWGVSALSALAPSGTPGLQNVGVNARVFVFALAVALATAVVFGLWPAVRAVRVDIRSLLGSGARTGGSVRGRRLRDALVVTQVAFAVMLLVGAGIMLTSFQRLSGVDTGITAEQVLTVPLQLAGDNYSETRRLAFVNEIVERAGALPGVSSAAVTITNPYRERGYANDVTPVDRAASTPSSGLLVAGWRGVTDDFFATLGIPLLRGRAFTAQDRAGPGQIAVISASLARELWPDRDAVGRELYWGGTDGTPRRVIGVVGDIRDRQLEAEPQPMFYLPYAQVPMPGATLLLRTTGDAATLATAVRTMIWSVDPQLPVPEVTPLARNRQAVVAGPRFRALLLACFAAVALLLATLGVYSVMAYAVAQRTREIGVRMALGAAPAAVAREVLKRGLALAALGMVVGIAGSLVAGRLAASLLYDTEPGDPRTLVAVVLVVALAALMASWVPSRRATHVDPARALRAG